MQTHKTLFTIFAFALLFPLLATTALAFEGGNGTSENPYQIATPEQLLNISSGLGAHYVLINDIDLAAHPETGNTYIDGAFTGSLDGQYYVIRNAWLQSTQTEGGFFDDISGGGEVRRLGFENFTITGSGSGSGRTGFLVDRLFGDSLIEEVYIDDTSSLSSGRAYIAGIAGQIRGSNNVIEQSYVRATLSTNGVNRDVVAGITGDMPLSDSIFVNRSYAATPMVDVGTTTRIGVAHQGSGSATEIDTFFDEDVSGTNTSGGAATPLSTNAMKDIATYTTAGWDITSGVDRTYTWGIDPTINDGYPFLQGFQKETASVENLIELSKTHESIHVEAEVTDDGGAAVTERGFVYSTSPNPDLNDTVVQSGSGLGVFSENVSGLNPDTTYYLRAYATNTEGTSYSNEFNTTTLQATPTVVYGDTTNVTNESAEFSAEVTSEGGSNVTERGFVYSTSPNPDLNDTVITVGSGLGSFDATATELNSSTEYFVRAYATNSEGTSYSTEDSFTTSLTPILPELADISVDGVYDNKTVLNLTLFSEILSEGSSNVSEHGFLWSNESFPNTNNESVTFMGGGLVEFNHTIQLEAGQTYYLLAYATNEEGTGYSEEAPITVEEEQPPAETPVGLVALLTALIGVFAVVIVLGVVLNMVQEQTTVHNNIMRKIVMITFLLILTGILIMQFGHFLI